MINARGTRIVASVSQFKIGTFFDGSQIIELTYLLPFLDDIDILPSTFVTRNKKLRPLSYLLLLLQKRRRYHHTHAVH